MDNKTALAVIEKARAGGALAYVGQGIAETVPLYKLEVSVIEVSPKDFHDKEVNGKILPRKEIVDKIGDAAGISFIPLENELSIERMEAEPALDLPARSVFVGRCQGKVRLSDGSWRTSSVETYAFDYAARAISEEPADKYKQKRKMQEFYKAGPMRAASGARLRVIHQLTSMPSGFDPKEINACSGKLVFSRIVQNTDYILSTHEGKMMAIAMATGAAAQLYGQRPEAAEAAPAGEPPMRSVGPAAEGSAAPDDGDDFALEGEGTAPPRDDPIAAARNALEDYYVLPGLLGANAKASLRAALDDPHTPLEGQGSLTFYLKQCKAIYDKQIADGRRTA